MTTASPPDQSMAEGIVDWFDIVGAGMLTRALQVRGTITVDHVSLGGFHPDFVAPVDVNSDDFHLWRNDYVGSFFQVQVPYQTAQTL